jgi:hypothetical protein
MRRFIKALIIVGTISWAASGLAAIQLTNITPGTLLEINSPSNLDCDSLMKDGAGAYAINVNLTNSGNTIIHAGVLGFFGSSTNLQNVLGVNNGYSPLGVTPKLQSNTSLAGTLFIGSGDVLRAHSIQVDTLSIGGRLQGYVTSIDVPEPTTISIWLLLSGLGLVFAWRKRKAS